MLSSIHTRIEKSSPHLALIHISIHHHPTSPVLLLLFFLLLFLLGKVARVPLAASVIYTFRCSIHTLSLSPQKLAYDVEWIPPCFGEVDDDVCLVRGCAACCILIGILNANSAHSLPVLR